jgi:hypothetical protein
MSSQGQVSAGWHGPSWIAKRERRLSYSVGMVITEAIHGHVLEILASARTLAVETGGESRDGAWIAELTGDLLAGWPKGMRLIVRKERRHTGAQLRLTDADGVRLTCFATNIADRRARAPSPAADTRGVPDPDRPGYRPAESPSAPHRPEPDLAGDRAERIGPAGLDADARPPARSGCGNPDACDSACSSPRDSW